LAPVVKKNTVKIGRPGYKVTKIRDHASRSMGLLFQIMYPEIGEGVIPRHRFMSAYEQKVEAPNRAWQYLIFTAEPYENVAFKVQSLEVEGGDKFWTHWDPGTERALASDSQVLSTNVLLSSLNQTRKHSPCNSCSEPSPHGHQSQECLHRAR
jgi:hypothetical protein